MFINHKAQCKTGPINLNQPDYSEEEERKKLYHRNWVMILQNETVDMLLKDEKIYYDDIENLYMTEKEVQEEFGPGLTETEIEEGMYENPKEVMQWWLIDDDHLFNFLRENNEVVAETDYGNYWGRTDYGVAIWYTSIFDKYWSKFGR